MCAWFGVDTGYVSIQIRAGGAESVGGVVVLHAGLLARSNEGGVGEA